MSQRRHWRLAAIALILLVVAGPLEATSSPPPPEAIAAPRAPGRPAPVPLALRAKIDPLALKEAEEEGTATFLVHLREQADLAAAGRAPTKDERRAQVVESLQATAQRSQRGVLAYLEGERASGRVASYRSYWIFNGLAVTATRDVLLELAARDDVAAIRANRVRTLPAPRVSESGEELPAWNLERIRVALAQEAFGVDGTGVVVANMDTGVDWTHPALQPRYRGYNAADPAASTHDYNWYDATHTYPLAPGPNRAHLTARSDHGTHTTGNILGMEPGGANRVGVAPGARWIAVRAFKDDGTSDDVTLHACFQWLLAPTNLAGDNPDPSRAPDIVSCSWGREAAGDVTYLEDLRAWRAAGIFPVFAAGNEGPGDGSINAPASYAEAFAVGATDERDRVADFSSRGPSPFQEIKPEAVAPGVDIRSTIAGGGYEGGWDGTSMAAPHVAGLVSLLYQAAWRAPGRHVWPPLDYATVTRLITSTAVDLGDAGPDTLYGWGRIDAYQAVGAVGAGGTFHGRVTDAVTGQPIAAATVTMTNREFGGRVQATADAAGYYTFTVAAGQYDVTAAHFYYQSSAATRVDILPGTTTELHFALRALPAGTVAGRISDAVSGAPVTATVSVPGTPAVATTASDGRFSLRLPAGTATLRVWPGAVGHRGRMVAGVEVRAGQTTQADAALDRCPRILFVDADDWRGAAEAAYYQADLAALLYPFDTWRISEFPRDNPPATALGRYDLVIWSQAESSPGFIGAWGGLKGYLESGGNLLISGQDIGYWDSYRGYGVDAYASLLHARYVADDSGIERVVGVAGTPLAGLTLTLNSADSAANQLDPSEVAPLDAAARPALEYQGDGAAALLVDGCTYRALYLAFGLAGAGSAGARRDLLRAGIEHLTGQRPAQAFNVFAPSDSASAAPGLPARFRISLSNAGRENARFDVAVVESTWPAQPRDGQTNRVITVTQVLSPCARQELELQVDVPPSAVAGQQGQTRLRVSPRGSSAAAQEVTLLTTALPEWTLARSLPTPRYRLGAAGVGCQVYVVGGLDSANRLVDAFLRYDLSTNAWTRLPNKPTLVSGVALVAQGGRLYAIGGYNGESRPVDVVEVYDPQTARWSLETHLPQPLGGVAACAVEGVLYVFGGLGAERTFDSVWAYDLSARTWQARSGMPGGPRAFAGAAALDGAIYVVGGWPALRTAERYDPRTDTWTTLPSLARGRQGLAVAAVGRRLYAAGGGAKWEGTGIVEYYDPALGRWLSAPSLAVTDRAGAACATAGGRLFVIGGTGAEEASYVVESLLVGTCLGGSGLYVDRAAVRPGERLAYTLVLRNPGRAPIAQARAVQPLPPHTRYVDGSASGGYSYDAVGRQLVWQGALGAEGSLSLSFVAEVEPSTPNGTVITSTASVEGDPCLSYAFSAGAVVEAPDPTQSSMEVSAARALPGDTLNYTLRLVNSGPYPAGPLSVSDTLPAGLSLVAGSVTGGAQYNAALRRITWSGTLPAAYGRPGSVTDGDENGLAFAWIDARGGTHVPLLDDAMAGPFPLGFPFRFFGPTYEQFYINSNGQVLLGEPSAAFSNAPIPSTAQPNNYIAAFWDDLNPAARGSVHFKTFGTAPRRYTVVQWTDVPRYNDSASHLTFQIVMWEENHEVWLQYLSLEGPLARGESATVGVENADGSAGLSYLYNGEPAVHALHDRLAVRVLPPLPLTASRHTISFRGQLASTLPANTLVNNVAWLTWGDRTWPLTATTAVALVDLGPSTLAVDPPRAVSGERLTCTLEVQNAGNYAAPAAEVEVPLPTWTEFAPQSASGGLAYQPATRRLTWSGALAPGAVRRFGFALDTDPQAPAGTAVSVTATLRDGFGQSWTRAVASNLLGSALASSQLEASSSAVAPGGILTYTVRVHNIGPATRAVVTDTLDEGLTVVEGSLWASAGQIGQQGQSVTWSGLVPSQAVVLLRFRARVGLEVPEHTLLASRARLDDGRAIVEREVRVLVGQLRGRAYLPRLER